MPRPITPFHQARRSAPMSHFVDESLPIELMLQAGTAKQQQQDDMMALVDAAGLWDKDSIKGGDTDLVDDTKESIEKFSDTYTGKNLTEAKTQSEVKTFLKGIETNKELKQVTKNYDKVEAYKALLAKLKAQGKAFDPSVKQAERTLNAYMDDSSKRGQEFGKIDIEAALNLELKESQFFDQMTADASEDFVAAMKNVPEGFLGKKGWSTITDKRVRDRATELAGQYATTPEGQQALAIYRELVEDFHNGDPTGINPDELSGEQYLAKRLINAGREKVFSKGTKSAQNVRPPESSGGGGNDKDDLEIIRDPENTEEKDLIDLDELEDTLNSSTASAADKQAAQAKKDKVYNSVKNSTKGKAEQANIENLVNGNTGDPETSLPQYTAEDYKKQANKRLDDFRKGNKSTLRSQSDDIVAEKQKIQPNLDIVYNKLQDIIPEVIQREIVENKNLDFATNLANENKGAFSFGYLKDSKNQFMLDDNGNIIPGIKFHTASKDKNTTTKGNFYSFSDMGVDQEFINSFSTTDEEKKAWMRKQKKSVREAADTDEWRTVFNESSKNKDGLSISGVGAERRMTHALTEKAFSGSYFATDNMMWEDGTDKLQTSIKNYNKLLKEREGTTAISQQSFRPKLAKYQKEMLDVLNSANPNNFKITNTGSPEMGEMDAEQKRALIADLVANAANGNTSMRVNLADRSVSITSTKGKINETFTIGENRNTAGDVAVTETFDTIYNMSGEQGLGDKAGASGEMHRVIGNKPMLIKDSMGQFAGRAYQSFEGTPLPSHFKIKLADETMQNDDYQIIGRNGAFTNDNIQEAYKLMYNPKSDLSQLYETEEEQQRARDIAYLNGRDAYIERGARDNVSAIVGEQITAAELQTAFDWMYVVDLDESSEHFGKVDHIPKKQQEIIKVMKQNSMSAPAVARDYNEVIKLATLMSAFEN